MPCTFNRKVFTSNPKPAQPLCFLRLSSSAALLERLYRSLNLIEPHLGPDLRSTLSVDLGVFQSSFWSAQFTILATLLPHLATRTSAGTHAITLKAHRVRQPTGILTVRFQPLSPRNIMILRLATKKCNQKEVPGNSPWGIQKVAKHFPSENTLPTE